MVIIMTEERTEYVRNSRRVNEWKSQKRNEKRFTFSRGEGGGVGGKSAIVLQ